MSATAEAEWVGGGGEFVGEREIIDCSWSWERRALTPVMAMVRGEEVRSGIVRLVWDGCHGCGGSRLVKIIAGVGRQ